MEPTSTVNSQEVGERLIVVVTLSVSRLAGKRENCALITDSYQHEEAGGSPSHSALRQNVLIRSQETSSQNCGGAAIFPSVINRKAGFSILQSKCY